MKASGPISATIMLAFLALAAPARAADPPLSDDLTEPNSNAWSISYSLETNATVWAETTGLRFDEKEKQAGKASVACDFQVSGRIKKSCGYVTLRWAAPEPIDLSKYRAVRFSYRVTANAPVGPWVTIVEDWGKGSGEAYPLPSFAADGKWHDMELPFYDFKLTPTNWAFESAKYICFACTVSVQDTNRQFRGTVQIDRFALARKKDVGQRKPALLIGAQPDVKLAGELKKAGYVYFARDSGQTFWNRRDRKFLSNFNVLILTDYPQIGTGGASAEQQAFIEMLRAFVEEGGGLLLFGGNNQDTGMCVKFQNELLRPYGAEVLREFISDPANVHKGRFMTYTWTDRIEKTPLTEGVSGLFYPMMTGWGGTSHANPVRVGDGWTVLARGMPSASTRALYDSKPMDDRPATWASSPPLLAVKQVGKGRIVLWPTLATATFTDGYHPMWDNGLVLDGKVQERSSQALALIRNLLKYLAEPSLASGALGGFEPVSVAPAPPPPPRPVNWEEVVVGEGIPTVHKILIGARTALSSGQGTVAEYAAEAREFGYQALVFTEDLEKMTPEKWQALKAECRKHATNDLAVVEGLKFFDENGNEGVVFGDIGWPKPEWMSEKKPGRLKAIWHLTHGYHFWPPVAVINPKTNPKRPWFLGKCKGYAAYTYANGQLRDESVNEYFEMMRLRFDNFVIAAHLLDSPAGVAAAARPENMQTYVRAPSPAQIVPYMSDTYNREIGWYWPVFVSNGPMIKTLAAAGGGDFAVEGSERIRLRIQASSSVPLREVRLLDGTRLCRRFLTGEPSFDRSIELFHDRQHAYIADVTDRNGRRAISWSRWMETGDQWFTNCGDNWNIMDGGKWKSSRFLGLRGLEAGYHRASVDTLYPDFVARDGDKTRNLLPPGYRAIHVDEVMVSRFASVIDYVFSGVYDAGSSANWNDFCQREGIVPIPSADVRIRCTFFTSRPDHPQLRLYEGSLTLKQPARLDSVRVASVSCGGLFPYDHLSILDASGMNTVDKRSDTLKGSRVWNGTVAPGGYLAFWPYVGGDAGIFALDTPIQYRAWHQDNSSAFYLMAADAAREYKTGDTLSYRVLEFLGPQFAEDASNRGFEWVRTGMGLSGTPAYQVRPKVGKVLSTLFTLRVQANDGGFRGRFTRAKLPMNVPVIVQGLNDPWQAGVWYKGTNRMWRAEWSHDDYGRQVAVMKEATVVDAFQPGPVEGGRGYFEVDTELSDKDVFLGNFLVCDNPDVFLQVLDRRPDKRTVEVHNPTDRPVKCTVRPAKGFDLLGSFKKRVVVPPGQSVSVDVQRP